MLPQSSWNRFSSHDASGQSSKPPVPSKPWLPGLDTGQLTRGGWLSVHQYPLNGCLVSVLILITAAPAFNYHHGNCSGP
ncbi:hypothetical protein ABBQ38_009720 [Trebouxia sp. C0009 RCD-2024]